MHLVLCCLAKPTIGPFAIALAPFPVALDWVGLGGVYGRGQGGGAGRVRDIHRDVLEWVMSCGCVAAA